MYTEWKHCMNFASNFYIFSGWNWFPDLFSFSFEEKKFPKHVYNLANIENKQAQMYLKKNKFILLPSLIIIFGLDHWIIESLDPNVHISIILCMGPESIFINIQFESCKFFLILTPRDNTGAEIIILRKIRLKFLTLCYMKILYFMLYWHSWAMIGIAIGLVAVVMVSGTQPSRGQSLPRSVKYFQQFWCVFMFCQLKMCMEVPQSSLRVLSLLYLWHFPILLLYYVVSKVKDINPELGNW